MVLEGDRKKRRERGKGGRKENSAIFFVFQGEALSLVLISTLTLTDKYRSQSQRHKHLLREALDL